MSEVPLVCPLCLEAVEKQDLQAHNEEKHGGEGLVQPEPIDVEKGQQ